MSPSSLTLAMRPSVTMKRNWPVASRLDRDGAEHVAVGAVVLQDRQARRVDLRQRHGGADQPWSSGRSRRRVGGDAVDRNLGHAHRRFGTSGPAGPAAQPPAGRDGWRFGGRMRGIGEPCGTGLKGGVCANPGTGRRHQQPKRHHPGAEEQPGCRGRSPRSNSPTAWQTPSTAHPPTRPRATRHAPRTSMPAAKRRRNDKDEQTVRRGMPKPRSTRVGSGLPLAFAGETPFRPWGAVRGPVGDYDQDGVTP